ncbi:GNAT family N-acetyltransferase [Sulfitobacter donghicola]|uniref:GNAT family acetyltransferase n=1 Tax=Sulfitobacter donghicola DSW-25 = KCTC 12864 = JCM 14565 TaxID=1300350 RepID=A0A073IF45_9RHOB|nr:GNAT family N-acetyltransferase [Sulfitobacter donghicola]KEJ88096.1 GNAT family acetyltransferase [Sulfitobacter donghicola DSW-25 = KCTC 12864 = JCM 14565]
MQIRNAQEADIPVIAQLWHLGWHSAHASIVDVDLVRLRAPAEFMTRTAAHLEQTYVAVLGGEIAGFFMIEGNEVYQFYVDPAQHGSGFARRMMKEAEARVPASLAWLACSVGNDRAAAFYAKNGWRNVGEEELQVETSEGPRPVRIWRFEKTL